MRRTPNPARAALADQILQDADVFSGNDDAMWVITTSRAYKDWRDFNDLEG